MNSPDSEYRPGQMLEWSTEHGNTCLAIYVEPRDPDRDSPHSLPDRGLYENYLGPRGSNPFGGTPAERDRFNRWIAGEPQAWIRDPEYDARVRQMAYGYSCVAICVLAGDLQPIPDGSPLGQRIQVDGRNGLVTSAYGTEGRGMGRLVRVLWDGGAEWDWVSAAEARC